MRKNFPLLSIEKPGIFPPSIYKQNGKTSVWLPSDGGFLLKLPFHNSE